jgi:GNAT superfamily N-acetyltransferase
MNHPQQGDYEIRPAREDDVPTLLPLVTALAEFERLAGSVTANEDDLRWGLFGPDAVAEAAIAWRDSEPAGFALWYEIFSTFRGRKGIYVEDLFVVPSHRGRGLGTALLRHVAAVAVGRGCFRLEWEVLGWNESAIAFYERLGGKRNDEWHVYTLGGEALERLARADNASKEEGTTEHTE